MSADEEEAQKPDVTAAALSGLMKMARHPSSAVALVVLAGPVTTYLMATYVAPAIHEGIEDHKVDPRAHPEQFERVAAIEKRLVELEKRYDKDTTAMVEVLGDVTAALKER